MPEYCDVAVPVPLDAAFTYRLTGGIQPAPGSRVLVPFRQQRLVGIVTELHDRAPKVPAKNILEVPDDADTPALTTELLRLGKWIGEYYLAPIGEVFRSMLPLSANFRRAVVYRIADQGRMALHLAGSAGSPSRSKRTPEDQYAEFRALDYLSSRDQAREGTLRTAARVSRALLDGMARKQWIVREDVSRTTAAAHTRPVALLKHREGKLNPNQRLLVETLVSAGGRMTVETLNQLQVPRGTLKTLVKRGLIELVEEPVELSRSGMSARGLPAEFQFNPAQDAALGRIQSAMGEGKFAGILLHGVTGSGKTAVYLAAMKSALDAGRSAILLVPEIGLTPAIAADVHHVFGDEVAILHSALSDKERAEHWRRIRRGEARAVVGTRSAVFAPVSDLALIIVDEEQDSSYKQEENPRYHARDVAVMRAKLSDTVVVLGSATPSLESYANAKKGRYALVEMPDRVEKRPLPEVELVDMRQEFQETGREPV